MTWGPFIFLEQKSQQFSLVRPQTMESQRGKVGLSLYDIKPVFSILLCGLIANMLATPPSLPALGEISRCLLIWGQQTHETEAKAEKA